MSADAFAAAEYWQSDVTFRDRPPLGSILVGRALPPLGGDTSWANMELADERLSDEVERQIEGRCAVHTSVKAFGTRETGEPDRAVGNVSHTYRATGNIQSFRPPGNPARMFVRQPALGLRDPSQISDSRSSRCPQRLACLKDPPTPDRYE